MIPHRQTPILALSNADWNDVLTLCFSILMSFINDFFSILLSTVESFIPHKKVIIRPHDKPWMTGQIRKAVRKRDHL